MKKTISIIISAIIIIHNILFGITVYASDTTNDYIYKYSGVTHSNGYNVTCTLTVTQINGERFRGTFSAEGISIYSFTNKPISGNVVTGEDLITFVFQVKFYNDRYYSNVYTTISPYEGTADCFCFGSWHLEDFKMTGEKQLRKEYSPSIDLANYDEDDMKLCMRFSKAAYSKNFSESVPDEIISIAKSKDFNTNGLISNNAHKGRKEENNISYTILPNFSKTSNSVDVYVILRGTTEEEWQGNMDITGEDYKDVRQHQSFLNGSEYLKNKINRYFELNYEFYRNLNVNLHITGHSRGAAVANLYAKYVSDNRKLGTIDKNLFANKVVAYTFATPNVEKFHSAMTNYNNIFNFCFYEDFVPTIPLTMPTDGWDYWKYGYTYLVSLSDFKKEHFYSNIPLVNKNDVIDVHNTMTKWSSVEKYYKKPCYDFNNTFSITAYNFFHDSFAKAMMPSETSKAIGIYSLYADFKQFPDFVPLIIAAGKNISTIINAHNYITYSEIISTYGSSCFSYCSYETYKNMFSSINYPEIQTKNVYSLNDNIISYNKNETACLSIFANQDSNLSILNWNLDDPSTWTGITWNANGNVENIDLSFKNLSGSLDLSNFSSLKQLNVTGNNLISLNLDNCSSLEEIDCSFNKLTDLDLSDCTNLNSITCCYNYLNTHEGSTLYNTLDDLMFSDCYVNYYPQSVPDNATFNTTELNSLKTFANTNNNNTVLNWLDDSGNIDTEKLQNNVLFEYDGSKYRAVSIDISDLDVSGALDLTSLSSLQELYCENTKITMLNIKGCTKLKTLHCDNCELESLTLPSNADAKTSSLYDVSCEYNYLDINIFTENIIKYIEFKAGASLNYKKQYINKDISAFDESDYNLLVNFANQRNNNKILDWNLSTPGKWENVSWRFDNTSGKYKLSECHFDFMEVKGNIDVSGCDMLDEVSFSGSKINTVTISGKNLNDSTFYGCSELEAVIIKGGSTIYEGTFKMCPTLQAIYIPSNITEIADKAFENLSNITIAGVADSYAQTYANEHNINFKPGAFICGNIVAKENLDDSYQYYYPVEDVSIVYKDEVQSTSDKLGYFVLFSTESGENQYKLEYPYGYNINQTTSITNNEPLIIENPIGLICYDWRNDGCINAKDYVELLDQIKKGSEITGIDDKYFDINKDGKVTEDDWKFACNFLLYPNPNK